VLGLAVRETKEYVPFTHSLSAPAIKFAFAINLGMLLF
jgi:hypothetical protein